MKEHIQAYAKRLKLSWIREHVHEVITTKDQEAFLLQLFENEMKQREERRTNLLFKAATLPNVSGKPFEWQEIQLGKEIDPQSLLEGTFIDNKENLIFYGGVGVGKTYLSTLIAIHAIQKDRKRVKFYTVASLVNQLLDAHEKSSLHQLWKQIEKLDLLILDELGYIPLHKQGAELLFQVISMCYEKRSIIITTNLQFGQWNHVFGDPILTEAVVDRLIHHSHLVLFGGESHRFRESMLMEKD
jgi:DNA replication protein DnaC